MVQVNAKVQGGNTGEEDAGKVVPRKQTCSSDHRELWKSLEDKSGILILLGTLHMSVIQPCEVGVVMPILQIETLTFKRQKQPTAVTVQKGESQNLRA